MLDALALQRLRSDDPAQLKLGLQCLPADGLADAEAMAAATRALAHQNADLRFLASYQFKLASRRGIDITPGLSALERLFADDRAPPMHEDMRANMWFTPSANAIDAVGTSHARSGNHLALRAMLAEPGRRGVIALQCVSSVNDIAPYLDVLQLAMTEGEPAPAKRSLGWIRRHMAAGVIAGTHWRKREWPALEALLVYADEIVRLAAFGVIDGAAEKDADLGEILPAVLRTFERQDPEFSETRHAAARVLLWRVLKEKRPRVLLVNGIDILTIPEVRAERKTLRRFARKLARDE